MPPVLDPAAMLEYIEKVRTPKKGQTSKNYSKHGSEAESAEASTENKAKDSTPTPSPKKSKASVLPFNLNLASPAAQFGLTSEPPPSPTQSSTGATVGDSPSSREDLLGDGNGFAEKLSERLSATHKRSVIGRGDIIDLLSTHDDDNLLLDEPVTPIQALGLRSYSPLIFQDGYKAEKKSTPDFQEASPAVFKAEDKLASYAQEASITDDQKAATTEPKRGGIISDGLAFIQSLIATPAKTYRSAVVVENPDEIDIDDDGEAGGEEWVTPRSRNELEALGEEHGEGAWPSAKNDDDIQPALTGNDNVSANVSQALPSITASTDSPKMSLKSQSAEYSSNVSGTPSPVVSRPNRFDEGRAAYLAEMAAAQASATRSKGPKAHFITGSAPKGSVRHARVYQRKELLEIGRKYRDVVLATLVANDHVGEKSIGIAMVSTGQAVGGIEGVVDVVRELGIGRGRGAL